MITPNICNWLVIYFTLLFCISLSELSIAFNKYELHCEKSTMGINISDWLIVKSLFTIFSSVLFLVTVFRFRKTSYHRILKLINLLVFFFNFIWIILGCLVFYNDCFHMTPENIKNFMWLSISFGFISLIKIIWLDVKYNNYINTRVSLLDSYNQL